MKSKMKITKHEAKLSTENKRIYSSNENQFQFQLNTA